MKQHLRVFLEVAALGTIAFPLIMISLFASAPVFNFFGSFGISLSFLDPLVSLVFYGLPLAVAFYYGYRRRLRLSMAAVWTGWIVSLLGYSAVMQVAFFRHERIPQGKPLTPYPWGNWLIWLALMLLPTAILTMLTMWGQRTRLRRRA